MSTHELQAKIREYRELQALIEEAAAEAEAIKDEIKAYMGDTEEIRAGEYKVTWKPVKSSRFNTTAFKKTHTDLYTQYTKESSSRRFCII